jgi:hypothetical protein
VGYRESKLRDISAYRRPSLMNLRRDGRVGPARTIDGRKVWDVRDLDMAFEALPMETNGEAEDWNVAV